MQKTTIYLLLFCVGAALPMIAFLPWIVAHGLNERLFAAELFANRISTFFALDLFITGCVVAAFARSERRRAPLAWITLPVMLLLGVSAALPLLLFLREQARSAGATAE
jgi:hypothetical protein